MKRPSKRWSERPNRGELSEAAVGTATQVSVEESKAAADSVPIVESETAAETVSKDNEVAEREAIEIAPAATPED